MSSQPPKYAARHAEHFAMERRDGVLLLRMHTGGGPAVMSLALHHAWGEVLREAGADLDNEVLILTGTGEAWTGGLDPALLDRPPAQRGEDRYDLYRDGIALLRSLVFSVDVPTIGALNGPGYHQELALACDLTLCTPGTVFDDTHFRSGAVPGDGQHLVYQELLGLKRAARMLYTGAGVGATEALELGLVNEVVPDERLLPRAWELAAEIMAAPRATRRLTHAIVQRPWQRRLVDDLAFGRTHHLLNT
ncbi:enoyl-CoA hydratase/isomerase family protein [Nonomuraea sp. NPDC049028]|uniref:enoyl-CoA hydratase/isomerase family protein n=1 Tax=Nonomuraea sp. NPDC049028 TaxID=3364348 RepID=UPI00371A41E7